VRRWFLRRQTEAVADEPMPAAVVAVGVESLRRLEAAVVARLREHRRSS
jgi:hypothetical protein